MLVESNDAREQSMRPSLPSLSSRSRPTRLRRCAKRLLGYAPRYNFPEFFEALKREDRSHYPYEDLPWWGV